MKIFREISWCKGDLRSTDVRRHRAHLIAIAIAANILVGTGSQTTDPKLVLAERYDHRAG